MTGQSGRIFEESKRWIPGGVNSPVRSFRSVGGTPPVIARAQGAKVFDVDGGEYIDYVCSWGALILGHAPEAVVTKLKEACPRGTSYGAPTELELKLARRIVDAFPAMDLVRLVNSGTEATMTAIRLARAYTGRKKIIKFDGGYHGHADSFLVRAGSGGATFGISFSPGVPEELARLSISLPFNDREALEKVIIAEGKDVAGVIIEPIPANMGLVLPEPGYLEFLREITERHGILLIFDEVITGFRIGYGGVQTRLAIKPDLTCLGKIIGGGLPIGAYGGRGEIMEMVAPLGQVYQAGTLSGNPLAVTAGLTTLEILAGKDYYSELEKKTAILVSGCREAAREAGVPLSCNHIGSMFSLFFTGKKVSDYESARTSDVKKFSLFFHELLKRHINLAPSQFETLFVSTAHSPEDIEATVKAVREALTVVD